LNNRKLFPKKHLTPKNKKTKAMRYNYILLFLIFLLPPVILSSQPVNDECINAILITEVEAWCSEIAEFNNYDATISPEASPTCFPNNQDNNDVWFAFQAVATTVNVSVIGMVPNIPGGNQQNPQFAVYEGGCDNLNILGCASDAFNVDQASLFAGPLNVGDTYYIRVSARFGFTGTFQLCINNFSEVPSPSGDCEPGVILCDKSPFTVGFLNGVGQDPDEIDNVSCNTITCDITESGSTWYKWTCDDSGTLGFSITPLNPTDDIDFVVYELPNGIEDCSGKFDLRCMASGENVGTPIAEWVACTGATGLIDGETDISETCGCQEGDNNFSDAIDMISGRSYALVINNFSQSGSGFSIEFNGTGTFLGPEVDFLAAPDEVCIGEPVIYTDDSFFIGGLEEWTWNFGPTATPSAASGPGPHSVVYNRPGIKSVVLTVRSNQGCLKTIVQNSVNVICCDDHFDVSGVVMDEACPNDGTGAIDLSVSSGYGPFGYSWDNGELTEDIFNLQQGTYFVTVVDEATCETIISFDVGGPPVWEVDTLIIMPTCNGGTDGAIELQVTGATPPYQYNWENTGFTNDNTYNNLINGIYSVVIQDANDCEIELDIVVNELILELDPGIQTITNPSCTGFSDGSIVIAVDNGLPPYQYDWNDGDGYVTANTMTGLPAGTYFVDVLDANLCMGNFELVLQDPPPLTLAFDIMDVSCFGESDGSVGSIVTGGTGDYSYLWQGGAVTSEITDLPAGNYPLTVTDENDCVISDVATVIQPPFLTIDTTEVIHNICFGYSEGQISVTGIGGFPPFEYSLDGENFQLDDTFTGLPAGDYTVTVLDANGCDATVDVTVNEPPQLLVEAGPDQFIELGFSTTAQAIPNFLPVTYSWSPLDFLECINDECSNIFLNPVTTTTYAVTIMDEAGCIAIDNLTIHVIKNRPIYIPNVFSPNGDGVNDGFTVYSGPAVNLVHRLMIFDRWGELVFDGRDFDPNNEALGWDAVFLGEPVNSGVFTYVADVLFIDGEIVQFKGDVSVIR
jgi:gliding motility-associated-like protein